MHHLVGTLNGRGSPYIYIYIYKSRGTDTASPHRRTWCRRTCRQTSGRRLPLRRPSFFHSSAARGWVDGQDQGLAAACLVVVVCGRGVAVRWKRGGRVQATYYQRVDRPATIRYYVHPGRGHQNRRNRSNSPWLHRSIKGRRVLRTPARWLNASAAVDPWRIATYSPDGDGPQRPARQAATCS